MCGDMVMLVIDGNVDYNDTCDYVLVTVMVMLVMLAEHCFCIHSNGSVF